MKRGIFFLIVLLPLATPAGVDAQGLEAEGLQQTTRLLVPLNKSKLMRLTDTISRVSKGNPDVANVVLLRPSRVLIQGNRVGTTNVLFWGKNDELLAIIDVEVTHDLLSLKEKLYELMPAERIEVRSAKGAIVLSGQVSSLSNMNAALDLARQFTDGSNTSDGGSTDGANVLNQMHVGGAQQVMLEVKVAEVSRSLLRRMNLDFQLLHESGDWTLGGFNKGAKSGDFNIPPIGLIPGAGFFGQLVSDDLLFNATIDAGKDNGLVQILAEPTLTAMTGQEASFLSGGEFPVPVPQGGINGGVTVEFKEFGIGVKFLPVVLDSERINLRMNIAVSELSSAAPVLVSNQNSASQFFIPSLSLRKATSAIELSADQTMSIAGLISDNMRENIEKFPWLGDIPGLGALFRSQNFQQNQSELVIFVTPRLAKPIAPDQVRLPTDAFVPPTDVEFYIMGRMEGRQASAARRPGSSFNSGSQPVAATLGSGTATSGGVEGHFGHILASEQ